jgi:hypothetical protein
MDGWNGRWHRWLDDCPDDAAANNCAPFASRMIFAAMKWVQKLGKPRSSRNFIPMWLSAIF